MSGRDVEDLFNAKQNAELLARIDALTADSKALWGKMNAAQMCAHCQVAIETALGRRKLKPNLLSARLEPQTSEKMMPPRMTRTAIAAQRVRRRKPASLMRRRCRTLARSAALCSSIVRSLNATSTTGRLPAGSIRLSRLLIVQGGPLNPSGGKMTSRVDWRREGKGADGACSELARPRKWACRWRP